MITPEQKRQLMKDFDRKPDSVAMILLKCAAGLAVVAGVALLGVETDLRRDTAFDGAEPQRTGRTVVADGDPPPSVVEGAPRKARDDQ